MSDLHSVESVGEATSDTDLANAYMYLKQHMTKDNKVKDRKWRLKKHKKCWIGEDGVSVLMEFSDFASRQEAVRLGTQLMEAGYFAHVNDKSVATSSSSSSSSVSHHGSITGNTFTSSNKHGKELLPFKDAYQLYRFADDAFELGYLDQPSFKHAQIRAHTPDYLAGRTLSSEAPLGATSGRGRHNAVDAGGDELRPNDTESLESQILKMQQTIDKLEAENAKLRQKQRNSKTFQSIEAINSPNSTTSPTTGVDGTDKNDPTSPHFGAILDDMVGDEMSMMQDMFNEMQQTGTFDEKKIEKMGKSELRKELKAANEQIDMLKQQLATEQKERDDWKRKARDWEKRLVELQNKTLKPKLLDDDMYVDEHFD